MPDDYRALLDRLTALVFTMADRLEEQRAMNQRLEGRAGRLGALLEAQHTFNAQQVAINADVRTTLARLETLLTRHGLRPGGNGPEG